VDGCGAKIRPRTVRNLSKGNLAKAARNTCHLKPLPPILGVPVRRLWK